MGSYVNNPPLPALPDWGDLQVIGVDGYTAIDIINTKYRDTMEKADEAYDKALVYLEALQTTLTPYNGVDWDSFVTGVEPIVISTPSITSPPVPSDIDTDYPDFTGAVGAFTPMPTVITLAPGIAPDEISTSIDWSKMSLNPAILDVLLPRILADLQAGATGLDPIIEADIFARAVARQNIEEDKAQVEIEDYFASRGFDLPPIAMAARLQEHQNAKNLRTTDLNGQIAKEQADLAQKNSQFIIGISKELEAIFRDYTNKTNELELDFGKAKANNAIAIYAESVKGFLAGEQAKSEFMKVQVEQLKGVIEYNKGVYELFNSEVGVYVAAVDAKTKKNMAITSIYESEVKGYAALVDAEVSAAKLKVDEYTIKISDADLKLRSLIAEAENTLGAYTATSNINNKVAESMAQLTMQLVASLTGSVNASVGYDYGESRRLDESFTHTENRSEHFEHSESITEQHSFEPQAV